MSSTVRRAKSLFLSCAILLSGSPVSSLFPFVKGGKTGLMDVSGTEIIAAQFGTAGDATRFQDGAGNVALGTGWGYIDATGKFFVPPIYWWANRFSEGIGCVLLPGESKGWAFVDRSGKLLAQGLKAESSFHEGLAAEPMPDKWGYFSRDMHVMIKPQFDDAGPFQEGRATVRIGQKAGYIDKNGNFIAPFKYDLTMPFSDGMGLVEIFDRTEPYPKGRTGREGQTTVKVFHWGAVNKSGVEIIPPQFLGMTSFSEGYAFAMSEGSRKWGMIDHNGNIVVPARFESASSFSESVAAVQVGKKWGYVGNDGAWVIPPTLETAEPFVNGLARVSLTAELYGYIDHSGTWVWRVDRQGKS